ncbi:hypothetical protein [Streptomyces caniscabiei]|uniref:hypothetical protein n=1 Tax=Streptomyces caniscabiei TaxID=2746961 RepID=UPI0038F7EB81
MSKTTHAQAKAGEVKQRHELELLRLKGVHGVGLGTQGGVPVIRVYADRASDDIPPTLEGVPVVIKSADGGFRPY